MTVEPPASSTAEKSYWIEFIGDRSIKIEEGQSILEASLKAGIPHYHECGGYGECSTCRILVQSGNELLSPLSEKEKLLRQTIPFPPNVRLACQTYVQGSPVYLHRIIRDEADMSLYVNESLDHEAQDAGHEREMALFFLDIREFTPFMETYLPFDVIHIMRRLFRLFRGAVETNKGRIIDTAGDGFYAVFGFENDLRTSAMQAFTAANTILEELEEFNQHYAEKYFFHHFEVGIGLHAGEVIVGNIGIGMNGNVTVMGLPVNIASRIQSTTRVLNNTLVVSDVFYKLLQPPPASRQMQLHLKGVRDDYMLHLCGKTFRTSKPSDVLKR